MLPCFMIGKGYPIELKYGRPTFQNLKSVFETIEDSRLEEAHTINAGYLLRFRFELVTCASFVFDWMS